MSTTSTTKVQGAQEQEVTTSKEQQMKQGKISHIMLKL
jgi:hypothetical protein